ncbi:MAG: hypothetical protein GX813_04630 [Erysipelotrichia bacterium]|nr:hypothetical protein [Erysipelotrichia bacterium]
MIKKMFYGKWTRKLINVLIWVAGYLSFVAYVIAGGYAIIKGNEQQKLTAKRVFIVVLLFLAATAALDLINNFGAMSGNSYYSSWVYDFYLSMTRIVHFAEIGVFGTFIILELLKKEDPLIVEADLFDE